MTTAGIRCTDTELELRRPLDELPTGTRTAVADWLTLHGVEAGLVPVGSVVERDYYGGVLHWREEQPDGGLVRRWRYATPSAWPAPFPSALRNCG